MPELSPETWTPDVLPRQLGPYQLIGVLGDGGTARVFDAHLIGPKGFEKPVALKVMKRNSTMPHTRDMLIQEARLASLIRHPNVVDVLDLGEVDGLPWIAMERIAGQTLKKLLRQGPLPPATALDLLQQIASGLSALHDVRLDDDTAGAVVHRDLKPANVLIDTTGRVRLVDFGIAVMADPNSVSDAWGTLAYMSPEQATGEPVQASSDVFSFGALVYEAFTGDKLWPGRKPSEVIQALLRVDERLGEGKLQARVEAAMPGAGEILRRCLRLDPAHRWPHGGALWEALDGLRHPDLPTSDLARRVAGPVDDSPITLGTSLFPAPVLLGRDAELSWLSAESARLRTLCGPLGVGKSALAFTEANRTRRGGAERVRLAPLRTARTPSAVLQQLADAIDVPRSALADQVQGAWTLGEALASLGPLLLILDDADEALGPLLRWLPDWLARAPELRVLLTARRPLGLTDEQVLDVDLLAEPDAVALLESLVDQPLPRATLRHKAQRIGGLPLALQLAASAGEASMPAGSGTDTTGDLPRHVRASLLLAWQSLDVGAQEVLAGCSVFRGGFTLADAVAVLDAAGVASAGSGLALLGDRGLLRLRTGRSGTRLVLDQPLLGFAAEHLAESPKRQSRLQQAHAEVYSRLGIDAAVAVLSGPRAFELQGRWVDELENLEVGLVRALDARRARPAARLGRALHEARVLGQDVEDLDALTRRLSVLRGMDPGDRLRLDLSRARAILNARNAQVCRDLLRTVIRRAREQIDAPVLATALIEQARLDVGAARYDRARAGVDEALALAEQGERRALQTRALRLQAVLHRRQGRYQEALELLDRAAQLCRALADTHYGTSVDALRALLHMDLGELDAAQALLAPAVALLRGTPDRAGLARQLGNLALLHNRLGDLASAGPLLEEALVLYQGLGQLRDATHAHQTLGSLALEAGDLERSLAQYTQAVTYSRHLSNKDKLASVLGDYAVCLRHRGELGPARAAMAEALQVARSLDQRSIVALLEINLAELYLVEGRLAEGQALAEDLLTRAEVRKRPRFLGSTQAVAGDAARRLGQLDRAATLLERALESLAGKDRSAWSSTLIWRGRLDLALGRLDAAQAALDEVQAYARAQGLLRRAPLRLAADHLARELTRERKRNSSFK